MKKILYIMCAVLGFVSCSQEEFPITDGQDTDGSYTFKLSIEEPDYVPKTKATVTMNRYLLEMYEGNLSATPMKRENTTGTFDVTIKKGVDYVCLFWADNGTSAYDAADLKAVKQTDETKLGTAAYFAKVTVNSKTSNGNITLKRAVAELSFIDKNGLIEARNTFKITYPYASATFNVGDGTVSHTAGTSVRTITSIVPPAQAADAFTTDFVIAPTTVGKITGLKFQLNSEAEKTVAETAVQANYRTKITGEYYKVKPKVKDFYYSDNTFLSTYDNSKTCVGIVFWVNPENPVQGKIVSLDEYTVTNSYKNAWGPKTTLTEANDYADGLANMAAIKDETDWQTKHVPFDWCDKKKLGGLTWYFPALHELQYLFCAYGGFKPTTWESYFQRPEPDAVAAFNEKLTTAGGTSIAVYHHWSSTEIDAEKARSINFEYGSIGSVPKDYAGYRVRAIATFELK